MLSRRTDRFGTILKGTGNTWQCWNTHQRSPHRHMAFRCRCWPKLPFFEDVCERLVGGYAEESKLFERKRPAHRAGRKRSTFCYSYHICRNPQKKNRSCLEEGDCSRTRRSGRIAKAPSPTIKELSGLVRKGYGCSRL